VKAEELPARISALVAELVSAGAADETLGIFVPSRGIGPLSTSEKFKAVGRAWRLGVLLVDSAGQLYATGELTRAIEPGRAAVNRSAEGERRRALRMAASRSGFPTGEVVNFGYLAVDPSADALERGSGPLGIEDGVVVVRVDPGSSVATDLERYLAERFTLLTQPE
jgi:hypothetical protein